jgi:hypothetical protein
MLYLAALALSLAALALLVYLTWLLWGAVAGPLLRAVEQGRMRRYSARLSDGDILLRDGHLSRALAAFEAALYPFPAVSRAQAGVVQRHHTGLLSRFIAAADQVQGERVRLISLAKVDRLFHQRQVLQDRYLAVIQGGDRNRRRGVERELADNTAALRDALHSLALEVETTPRARLH